MKVLTTIKSSDQKLTPEECLDLLVHRNLLTELVAEKIKRGTLIQAPRPSLDKFTGTIKPPPPKLGHHPKSKSRKH
jgi:hypothetical protein